MRCNSQAITGRGHASMTPAQWRTGRWALRTGENKLNDDQRVLINQIARTHRHIGRAWTLKEQLRDIYRLNHPPGVAWTSPQTVEAWTMRGSHARFTKEVRSRVSGGCGPHRP